VYIVFFIDDEHRPIEYISSKCVLLGFMHKISKEIEKKQHDQRKKCLNQCNDVDRRGIEKKSEEGRVEIIKDRMNTILHLHLHHHRIIVKLVGLEK